MRTPPVKTNVKIPSIKKMLREYPENRLMVKIITIMSTVAMRQA